MSAIQPSELSNETSPVTTNTRSQYLRLNNGLNRVGVRAASWNGSKTAALKYFAVPDTDAETEVQYYDRTAVEFVANNAIDMYGPGLVAIDITSTDGVGVYLYVLQCETLG